MNKKLLLVYTLLTLCYQNSFGQEKSKLNFSGYSEVYFNYDVSEPNESLRPNFLYNHKRNKEVNINLAFAKATYSHNNIRANAALMVGNYAQYNLANEDAVMRHVFEANIGVRVSNKNNVWLDAGVMPSHIGFESAIAQDCWTPSRSIVAENSPYFNSGIKLSSTNKKENLNMALLVLNGWQRIQKVAGNNTPSLGMQINYKPNTSLTLNYSNFLGTDKADSLKALRTYHNFYAIYEPAKKVSLIIGFDIGTEKFASINATWYTPVLIARYKLNTKNTLAARAEYFSDQYQIVANNNNSNAFKTSGLSLNYDYNISPTCMWRIEAKYYNYPSALQILQQNNFNALTSLSIKF